MLPKRADKPEDKAPVVLEIEKLVYGGGGLGRLNGQAVLVPFVLPGERVAITTQRVKTGLLRGLTHDIVHSSLERVIPRCEYFGDCGGCHYQHAEYAFQLEQKREVLRETLQRIGGISYQGEIHSISGEPWFYRNRIQLHFAGRSSGFHRAGSQTLCAISRCYISSPTLVDLIAKLQAAAREPQWPAFLRSLELFTNEAEIQMNVIDSARPVAARFFEWCRNIVPSLTGGPIMYSAAGHSYRVSRGSFFQVNRFLIDALVQEAIGAATGTHAVDLYAGVGLFSLPLASRFEQVDAVEHGGPAFRDLQWNAAQRAANIRPAQTPAEEFVRQLERAPDFLLADPPRAGLGRDLTDELLRLKAPTLALVSCDPATLARDLKKLLLGYEIEKVTLVDLFPQTYHFEVVVHLSTRRTACSAT